MDIFARGPGCTRTLWILTPPFWTAGKHLDFRLKESRRRWKSNKSIAKRHDTYPSKALKLYLLVSSRFNAENRLAKIGDFAYIKHPGCSKARD
jgi:hypothetical protein